MKKLLANENIPSFVIKMFIECGYEVLDLKKDYPRLDDLKVVALEIEQNRII